MINQVYPWGWLTDRVGTAFVLRCPWVDAVRRAVGGADAVCLIVPEAAGALAPWGRWLADLIDEEVPNARLLTAADFREAASELCDAYSPEHRPTGEPTAVWSRHFLAACRREMPDVSTVPLLITGADDGCTLALRELARAQRDLSYPFVRPVVLRRTTPLGWEGELIRFGLPEWVGDLSRIAPSPARDMDFWMNLLLALTVAWEAAAIPPLADELWEHLQLRRTLSLRDAAFDAWLDRELLDFAKRNKSAVDCPLPRSLAFGPLRILGDERPWHMGAIAWEGDAFDVTPMRARLWTTNLDPDAHAALRRRRLTNVPLARWLSAWASSIEESLRVAILQAGEARFRRFLEGSKPWRRDSSVSSRLDELGFDGDGGVLDRAQFGDLTAFLARHPPRPSLPSLPRLLESCRVARNRIVHQRLVSTRDFLDIANMACLIHDAL